MLAYLAMMAPHLVELRRVLKPAGSSYLHCDPTASHYLRVLIDAIFGVKNHRAEIIWKRSSAHSDARQGAKQPGHIHDVILFYTKSDREWTWNAIYTSYAQEYIEQHYSKIEPEAGRRFKDTTSPPQDLAEIHYMSGKSQKPPKGRYWAYSQDNMRRFEAEGRLYYTSKGFPRLKQYPDEMPGLPLQDLWDDIPPINSQAAERLGYPTQKPEALLERIIKLSSNESDTVLDPFCGCGTAITVAQRLHRRWIGIAFHLAITLIKHRLQDAFGNQASYKVIGEPVSLPDAETLARQDPYQFQWWALGLVGSTARGAAPWSRSRD